MKYPKIKIAAKCAPQTDLLDAVVRSGLSATELFTSPAMMDNVDSIIELCRKFPLQYAIHAPADGFEPEKLRALADGIGATALVVHPIYWDEEWKKLADTFAQTPCRICIENADGCVELMQYLRRYKLRRCVDLEHLTLQAGGIFTEPFVGILRQASHVHMTGYVWGQENWHTHIHHSPDQGVRLLDIVARADFDGLVVSEADVAHQTVDEFRRLKEFFDSWQNAQ